MSTKKISSKGKSKASEVKEKKQLFPFKCGNCGQNYIVLFENEPSEPIAEQSESETTKPLAEQSESEEPEFPLFNSRPRSDIHTRSYFDEVVRTWGFIALRSVTFLYFGFTCLKCKKTSIYKYKWKNVKREFDTMFKKLAMPTEEESGVVKWFTVPFSISNLINLGFIKPLPNVIGIKNQAPADIAYSLKVDYYYDGEDSTPKYTAFNLNADVIINSQDIDKFLKIENEEQPDGNRYKVFPRIIRPDSINRRLDGLKNDIYTTDGTNTSYFEMLKKLMIEVVDENRKALKLKGDGTQPNYRVWIKDNMPIKVYEIIELGEGGR